MTNPTTHRRSRSTLFWISVYLLGLLASSALLWQARHWAVDKLDNASAEQNWETWKDSANQPPDQPPTTTRRAPQTDQPPTLVLLRDHFWLCWIGVNGFGSLVALTTSWMIRGAMRSGRRNIPRASAKDSGPS